MSSRHHLAQVLGERTLHNSDTKSLANEVAAYLLQTGHTNELESLMRDIMAYRAERGVVEATATSANPLSSEDLDDINDILKLEFPHAKQVAINQEQQAEVVGGVKLTLPGEQLDLTVKSQVNKFKRLTTSQGA
jgi:F0F1-type ATP synthase delta subunit